jgi:hypothetical protein
LRASACRIGQKGSRFPHLLSSSESSDIEEGGVIVGYHAHIKPSAVGRSVEAFIKGSIAGDKLLRFAQTVKKTGEVVRGNSVEFQSVRRYWSLPQV